MGSNLFLVHNNILADAVLVSGSEQANLSSAQFLCDDRLSFKFTATGTHTLIKIDQASSAIDPFRYLVLVDHTMSGGTAVVRTYPTEARSSATVVWSGSLAFDEPNVTDFGAIPAQLQYVDVELTASGGQRLSVGELMLASRFESPRFPAPGIVTDYLPRRTFIDLQNGERQSVRHGGVVRHKVYSLEGLDEDGAAQWVEVFDANEGARLVVLTDDEGDTYPALLKDTLSTNKTATRFDLGLEFTEVKLT